MNRRWKARYRRIKTVQKRAQRRTVKRALVWLENQFKK